MNLKFFDYYLIFLYYFDNKLTDKDKKLLSMFFIDILNGFDIIESFTMMKNNALKLDLLKYKDIKLNHNIKNININYNFDDNNNIIYNIDYNIDGKNNNIVLKSSIKPIFKNIINNDNKKHFPELYLNYLLLSYDSGQFISIDPKIKIFFSNKYGNDNTVECFSSIFNKTLKNFCTLLDIEKQFGSLGNFFHLDKYFSCYLMNPPYTENMMNKLFYEKIVNLIKIESKNILIVLIIPNWKDLIDKYIKHLKYYKIINYNKNYLFYHFIDNKYLNNIIDSVIIFISNKDTNFDKIINELDEKMKSGK